MENSKMLKITIASEEKLFPEGITYRRILEETEGEGVAPAMLVRVDGQLKELNRTPDGDCSLEAVRINEVSGFSTYRRSMLFLLLAGIRRVAGMKAAGETVLHHSAGNGFYLVPGGDVQADAAFLSAVKAEMQKLIDEKKTIRKESVPVYKARKIFEEQYMQDKARLFRYRMASHVNLYELDGMKNYFYGFMVPDTGYLGIFDLMAYGEGFLLLMPESANPEVLPELNVSSKVFQTQVDTAKWYDKLGIRNVGELNDAICSGTMEDTFLYTEALQEGRISDIAKEIVDKGSVKFVLIAGPSSSGKTTFSRRLSVQLKAKGMHPYPISFDNYYVNREDTPLDENGDYDFECLEAIDVDLFNRNMKDLLNGERVELPYYNFKTGQREYRGEFIQLKEGDVLVLEGIHGLNDRLTEMLPSENKYRIYISALTQLNLDNHNRIPTTDGRLIRRMVRDYRTRGTSAASTIARWPSVRRGEEKHIFPYQDKADATFNSALIFELSVLKTRVVPLLYQIPEDTPEYEEAKRLLKFMDYFVGVPSEGIANNSILREFVGGGCFDL